MSNPYIITDTAITVFIDNKGYTVNNGDDRYTEVKDAIRTSNFDVIPDLLDLKGKILEEGDGQLYLLNGVLKYKDEVVESLLSNRIIAMRSEGYDITPLVKFLENIASNPTSTAKRELYGFIENSNLPITDDGHFLAYKMVATDFTDLYTHSMDNSVGVVVKMNRSDVDSNRAQTCSSGLHFCSEAYLGHYGCEGSSQVVVLKINPRDVVSIPTDYDNAKGRACEYKVVGAIGWDELIKPNFSDEYRDEPVKELVDEDHRWDVYDSNSGELYGTFLTRNDAREFRAILGGDDVYIWDNLNELVVVGVKYSDYTDGSDDDGVPDNDGTGRWEVRDSMTGAFKHAFNSRKIAREYLNDGEFIWDATNQVKINGSMDESVDTLLF